MARYAGNYNFTQIEYNLEPTVSTLLRLYEKLAHCSYEKQCAISRLNAEVLAPIFSYLETEDRKHVRLTCRTFKDSIDNYVGIHVNLDQRKINNMQELTVPPPGAQSIRLWSINSSKFLDYILRKPDLIREVCFSGQINLSAFTKIVSRCKNLRKLSLTDRSHLYANIVPMSMDNLHTLDLGCPGYSTDYSDKTGVFPSLWLTYEILMKRLIAPNLKVLRIFFCCVEECSKLHEAIAQIFRFLAVHDKVKDLSVNLHHRYEKFNFLEGDVNYKRFRIDIPKKILRQMRLEKLHVETMEPAFKVWDFILPGQKHLTYLDLLNRGRRWFYFTKIVSNNFATLRFCRLLNISPKRTKTRVLDLQVFEKCQVLDTLFLSRFENSTQEIVYCYPNETLDFPFLDTETSNSPEMENIGKLPTTLKALHIQGLVLSTHDLCEGIPRLKNLKLLELQLTGYHIPPFSAEDTNQGETSESYKSKKLCSAGLGVTEELVRIILQSCRVLDTLFIEEFENPWTKIRGSHLSDKLCKISQISGDGFCQEGEYYGILVCASIPGNSSGLTRSERMHLWGVRVSQYCLQDQEMRSIKGKMKSKWRFERDGVKDLAQLEQLLNEGDDLQSDSEYSLQEPLSSTSLLELLDEEKGQLEEIKRLLNAGRTPPPLTPTKLKTEHTQLIAEKYSDTLFSAIPNYHKASRLQLDPTEKFSSFFPRSKSNSRVHMQAAVLKKIQNSHKLLGKDI